MESSYQSSPIRRRRTKREIEHLKGWLYEIVQEYRPMTVRQVFYQAVSKGVITKSENEYNNVVVRLLTQMRREGSLAYGCIADNTRWMRKPDTHSSAQEMLIEAARTYRRQLWQNQGSYVEVWLEKEALAGVLLDVTSRWDVPLMVTRGYSSVSFLHSAAEVIAAVGKPAYLYYFGDHDPSGLDISRNVEESIREMAPEADLSFTKVAVTEDQIQTMNLPTRPTKATDTRSRNFQGRSVEVDAIAPPILRSLAEEVILSHIEPEQYYLIRQIENEERDLLEQAAVLFGQHE